MDSSQKKVYPCEICKKWFCETHLKPKFPYFVDWDTVFDVQGNPEVKALFYSEYKRLEGHADFVYLRKTVEALKLEEKVRNMLINRAIDRMVEANRLRTKRANERAKQKMIDISEDTHPFKRETKTYENKFRHEFSVPKEVYADKNYRERLNNANLLSQVEAIVTDYYKRYSNEPNREQAKKKKHWWQ